MKKVSIQICTYNQEDFIVDTIESCLAQTYENIEICVSDDGSTDKTFDIISEYKLKYPNKIKALQQAENMGKYSIQINYNSALSLCTGEYIALLDGDDIMLPDRIEKQIAFLENNPDYIGVAGWVEAFDSKTGKILGNIHKDLRVNNRTTESLIKYGNSIPPCLLYKKIDSLSACTRLTVMGDWLFYIELSIFGKIGHIDEYLCRYRIHENNSIKKDLSLDHLITLDVLDSKYKFKYFKDTNYARVHYFASKGKRLMKKNIFLGLKILLFATKMQPGLMISKIYNSITKSSKIGGIK